jgi:hypothetical protein
VQPHCHAVVEKNTRDCDSVLKNTIVATKTHEVDEFLRRRVSATASSLGDHSRHARGRPA